METDPLTRYHDLLARYWVYNNGILLGTTHRLDEAMEEYEANPDRITVWDDEIRDWIF